MSAVDLPAARFAFKERLRAMKVGAGIVLTMPTEREAYIDRYKWVQGVVHQIFRRGGYKMQLAPDKSSLTVTRRT